MCNPALIQIGAAVIGAGAAVQQGQAAKQVGRNNQIMAEYAAQDAEKRGEVEAQQVAQRARALKGAQRSRMAAAGLDLGVGTQADIQESTDFFAAQDVATTRTNARKAAWSARASGNQAAAEGRFAADQGRLQAFSTLLGTAGQVAGKWKT